MSMLISLAVNLYKCLSLLLACGYFYGCLGLAPILCHFITPDMSEYMTVSNEPGNACFNAIISWTLAVVRWSWKGLHCVLYGPGKGLFTACGLVKGLLNCPEKG